jgi:transposase
MWFWVELRLWQLLRREVVMAGPLVSDELWEMVEPLIPVVPRRFKHPGRKRIPDRQVLTGIMFVLQTGIPWEYLPQEMGCGSGMTCWRRLHEWQQAGVWQQLHEVLLARLHRADLIDWSRAAIDSSHVRAVGGARKPVRARWTGRAGVPSTI